MLYIPYDALTDTLEKGLLRAGLDEKRAAQLADVFAGNSADGVYSHGVNRYMRFLGEVEKGIVDLKAETEVVSSFGALEVRDAHFGIGPINAEDAMARAVALSKEHGIACVAVRNTNHWLRPGRYGWQAANAGVIGMCWSNTINNMPAWGAVDPRLGNNPIVLAIPRKKGNVVVDLAMTQFAFGKLEIAKLSHEQLPIYGGYDENGNLTSGPGGHPEEQAAPAHRLLEGFRPFPGPGHDRFGYGAGTYHRHGGGGFPHGIWHHPDLHRHQFPGGGGSGKGGRNSGYRGGLPFGLHAGGPGKTRALSRPEYRQNPGDQPFPGRAHSRRNLGEDPGLRE